MQQKFNFAQALIRIFSDIYTGYSFTEISDGLKEIWCELVANDYDHVNELEYE